MEIVLITGGAFSLLHCKGNYKKWQIHIF